MGLRQADLAKLLRVTERTVANYEKGNTTKAGPAEVALAPALPGACRRRRGCRAGIAGSREGHDVAIAALHPSHGSTLRTTGSARARSTTCRTRVTEWGSDKFRL